MLFDVINKGVIQTVFAPEDTDRETLLEIAENMLSFAMFTGEYEEAARPIYIGYNYWKVPVSPIVIETTEAKNKEWAINEVSDLYGIDRNNLDAIPSE